MPIVFLDFAAPDADALGEFYSAVFGWSPDAQGKFEVPVTGPLHCAYRADPAEKRVYVGVPDVAATLAAIEQAGGSVDTPRFEVPGVVVRAVRWRGTGGPAGAGALSRGPAGSGWSRNSNDDLSRLR